MKSLNLILGLFVTFLFVGFTYAQGGDDNDDTHTVTITVPAVALVDIEPSGSKDISLTFTHSTEAGDPLTAPAANTSLWLNYSSIKDAENVTRTVSVKIGALFPGVDIKVLAAADAGNGDGTMGTVAGLLTLTTTDQTIISGIGSCYTATGVSNGHNLSYTMVGGTTGAASYADFTSVTQSAVTVTYTISDI